MRSLRSRSLPLLVAGALYPLLAGATDVRLTADVDRNGVLNSGDNLGKTAWTATRGAMFLVNCDSDNDSGTVDAADAVVNGAADVADLTLLRVDRLPALESGAVVTASVDQPSRVRLFLRNGSAYTALTSGAAGNIPAAQLAAGDVELYLEGREFASGSWNGEVTVTVAVTSATEGNSSDAVRLKAAPFLLLPHTQSVTEIYIRAYTGGNETFISQVSAVAATAGVTVRISPSSAPYNTNDIWMQDAQEIGYTELPTGHGMNVVLKSNRGGSWLLSNFPYDELLAPNYGWIQVGSYRSTYAGGSAPNGWLDWFGNLECTPPLPGYPYGRIFYGKNGTASLDPTIVAMLDAQGLQGPALALDVGWLLIKHVDEMICWVPSNDPANLWKVLVPDTTAMIALLDAWQTAGHGSRPILQPYATGETVATLRSDSALRTTNTNLQSSRIEPMITSIKSAWGLTEAAIIRVPSYYESSGAATIPSMVNSVVMNGHFLVSDPHGPEPAGTDLLQQDLINRLTAAQVPLTVHFVDDQRYHKWSGNTHCATNVRRTRFTSGVYATSSTSSATGWAVLE